MIWESEPGMEIAIGKGVRRICSLLARLESLAQTFSFVDVVDPQKIQKTNRDSSSLSLNCISLLVQY